MNRAQPCPLCDAPMEQRPAGDAGQSGTWFWACTRFPHCRGMITAPLPAPRSALSGSPSASDRTTRGQSSRVLPGLALALLVVTLLGIALLGSVPTLLTP